ALPGSRKRRLLYAFVLAYYLSAVLYFINSRYRLPLVPFLLLFAGFALERGWTNLRRGRFVPVLLSLPVLAFLTWVVNPQVLGISSPRFYLNMGAGHNHLGSWYTQQGDLERALKEFTEARRLEPYRAEANFNLGSTLLRMKRYREAEAYFREAVRINPFYESAHLSLGYIFEVSGDTAAAEAKYREIIANLPGSPSAWLQLARLLIREGEPGKAGALLEEGLVRHGGNELFFLYLALAREGEGNLPGALAAVERGTAALPDSGLLQGETGRLILKTGGDPNLAARYLERAVRLRPADPLPRLWLGDLLAASGRAVRARALWEEGAALAPDDPRFRERLDRPEAALP
nr:tetratricopeptide repeat protein [bacterium]